MKHCVDPIEVDPRVFVVVRPRAFVVVSHVLLLLLDKERNITVVMQHVSLEDVRAGAEDAFESGPVKFDAFKRTPGGDCGSAGSVK